MNEALRLLRNHPHWPAIEEIAARLRSQGHRALLAGGGVRDALLGVTAKDLDVATSATPPEIQALFEKTVAVGAEFGVVRVLIAGADIEVATFRSESDYRDGRHPSVVKFPENEKEDALRRDFTVNALFLDLETGEVLDYVAGVLDLRARTLRAVGRAQDRFQEDRLRILRAVRLSAQLGFEIEPATWAAVRAESAAVAQVSRERIRDELYKAFKTERALLALPRLRESGIYAAIFPFLSAAQVGLLADAGASGLGGDSRAFSMVGVSVAETFARWLYPLAGDLTAAEKILESLKLSKNDFKDVMSYLRVWHELPLLKAMSLGARLRTVTDSRVRWALRFQATRTPGDPFFAQWEEEWAAVAPGDRAPLPLLSGEDLRGLAQGPAIGEWLQKSFEAQLEGAFNDRTGALNWLKSRIGAKT